MFNKKETIHTPKEATEETVVGQTVKVTGNLESTDNIRIEGQVKGSVKTKGDIMLGGQSRVEAESIQGQNIVVAGEVLGKIKCQGLLEVRSTGKLIGDISCEALVIEQGGRFDGNCQMNTDADSKPLKKKI